MTVLEIVLIIILIYLIIGIIFLCIVSCNNIIELEEILFCLGWIITIWIIVIQKIKSIKRGKK